MVSRMGRAPALGPLRLANVDDSPYIFDLVNETMSRTFRVEHVSDITNLIENCVLSICQLDTNDAIVGFLAAKDYPMIPSVHPRAWEEYIWTKYKTIELTARNTLFIHLLCWNPVYSRELVDNILKSMFMHDSYLQYVAMTKTVVSCPLLVPGQSRSEASFARVQPQERGVPGDSLPSLCIAERGEVCPRLRIRRAVEEDNDDIVPIIERLSPKLREIYGEFYVSELISRHPESERVLMVCEHKELAVGVMCLNTQINYGALEENFELSPFGGLRHLDSNVTCKDNREMKLGNNSVSTINVDAMTIDAQVPHLDDGSRAKARITWLYNEDEFKEVPMESQTVTPTSTTAPPTGLEVLSLLQDDEEELDFDIINIDTNLLRVPKILTYDTLGIGLAATIMKILDDTSKRKETAKDKDPRKDKHKLTTSLFTDKPVNVEPTRYSGTPNAFLLELFAMHPDYDERYGFDMLEAAYELFPDRDYCVMCLPTSHPPFPLLEHFTLVTPYSTQLRFINSALYVAHINSIRGDVAVRIGETSDAIYLNGILEHAPRVQSLQDLFYSSLTSDTLISFMLLSQNQPVGMVILGSVEDATPIRTQYALEPEPRRPQTDGTVLAGVLSPALEPHSRWYLRELLRHSHYTSLFWICRLFAKGEASPSRNLMSLAGYMTPVLPRQSVPNISGNKQLDHIFQDFAIPFALWAMERPLTSLPRVFVNNSIVVVGASSTGLAFVETLIMGPASQYLTFSNITLVSEHGLPTMVECLKAAMTCVPHAGRYTDRYLKSVPFFYYVDVMSGVMVGIDRKKKCIHLKGGGTKFYDALVITCGHQFQHPEYLHHSLELVKENEKGKPCERILMDDPQYQPDKVPAAPNMPENLMLISSLFEANIYLRNLLRMINETKDTMHCLSEQNQVVVYGECIETYTCLSALLELGLSPRVIAFVEPFPSEDGALRVNCFNNETVDERIQTRVEDLGIRVIRRCTLAGWKQVGFRIEALYLMSPLHAVRLPCFAFFYYGIRAIDINAFKAINECGLVYDGGVVVGPEFETNDPHVFAAGPCVKYSRCLYADRFQQHYYCSEDVGEALAKIFLQKFDPFVMAKHTEMQNSELTSKYSGSLLAFKNSSHTVRSVTDIASGLSRRWQPVMLFDSPIVQYCTLPGPFFYMKLRKPGPEIPMEVQLSLPHQGHVLITDKQGNYFRLRLNALHCIEDVTCLSGQPFSSEILSQLYGKHEGLFHQLLYRFTSGEIDDFYEFFTQPWMAALYQETFTNLLQDINEQEFGTISQVSKLIQQKMIVDNPNEQCEQCTCTTEPSDEEQHKVSQKMETFRSVLEKYLTRNSSSTLECGQSIALRRSAHAFWRAVGGEQSAVAHVSKYLRRHAGTNLHYARPVLNSD